MSKSVGEFLAVLRKANGYTQQEVAEKLNISNRTLSSWETDRTTPDILLLPAIADLYGVTVDELLRGERTEKSSSTEISESAVRAARKHRFGKYSSKCSLLFGLGCLSACIFALSFILSLYSSSPLWLNIMLMVTGICGVAVCMILVFYFCNCVKLAEGIVLNEDYTEDKKAFALALKRKTSRYFIFCALPLLALALILLVVFLVAAPEDFEFAGLTVNVRATYIIFILINASLGIVLLAAEQIYYYRGYKMLADERRLSVFKHNKKLAGKIVGFGLIPLAVTAVLLIVLIFALDHKKLICSADNIDEFRRKLQTITIDEGHEIIGYGLPAGEYSFDFPNDPIADTKYDVGNGFIGTFNYIGSDLFSSSDYGWLVEYPVNDEKNHTLSYLWYFNEYEIYNTSTDETEYFYALEKLSEGGEIWLGFSITYTFHYGSEYVENGDGGEYRFYKYYTYYMNRFAANVFSIVTAATVAACCIIYATRRKKQNFDF